MKRNQVLLIIAILYFALMVFPNATGAENLNMVAIFEKDEFAQYEHAIRMLTPGDSLYDTVRHFVVYLHYFYGYPFYLLSAIMLLPYRLLAGMDWVSSTQSIMLLLRQLVSVLPMILAIALMAGMQTRHKSKFIGLGLFVFLLAVPAVIVNNFWWHPDSLAVLLIVLVFYCLDRDDLDFGIFFYLAAFTCGVAFSVKYAGAFFVLAIPAYLVYGIFKKRLPWKRGLFLAPLFVIIMALGLVISNPLLLLPMERQAILDTVQRQIVQTRIGYYSVNPQWNLTAEKVNRIVWPYYGQWFSLLLMVGGLIQGLRSPRSRTLNLMILMYFLPYMYTVGTSSIRPLYFLPVIIPFASALVHLFPDSLTDMWGATKVAGPIPPHLETIPGIPRDPKYIGLFQLGALGIIILQFGVYIQRDIQFYQDILYREDQSPNIAFYQDVETVLEELNIATQNLVVYRDLTAYVPPKSNYEVIFNWRLASYDFINRTQPDLLILEMDYILAFTKPNAVANAVDPGDMKAWQQFYGDAYTDQIPGFEIIYQNDYGLALLSSDLKE
jgi:hypothetical protein